MNVPEKSGEHVRRNALTVLSGSADIYNKLGKTHIDESDDKVVIRFEFNNLTSAEEAEVKTRLDTVLVNGYSAEIVNHSNRPSRNIR